MNRTAQARPATAAEAQAFAADTAVAAEDANAGWWVIERDGRTTARALLRPRIGLDRPRYWYHVGCVVHAAAELQLFRPQQTLLLGNDLTGAAELAALHAEPGAEADLTALVTALRRHVAGQALIAELPGLRDSADQSPFWHGLGRHFYAGDPRDALARHGAAWRSHVAALLPRQLVYSAYLHEAAQAAIGATDPAALALRAALEAAGLRYRGHVAIDDGGAVLEADPV